MLDWFALFVLLVIAASIVGGAVLLAMFPGRIARARNHPQAEAISVCGWWGLLTFGLLLPIAYIWAYTDASQPLFGGGTRTSDREDDRDSTAETKA